jgi:hypothetical protein
MAMTERCPNLANHTPMPDGYLARQERAEELMRTHRQTRCPGCGLWAIWVPKGQPATVVMQPAPELPADMPAALLELRRLADEVREDEAQIDRLIGAAKARGCSWALLGQAMGITGDGVRMRMARRRRAANEKHEEAM